MLVRRRWCGLASWCVLSLAVACTTEAGDGGEETGAGTSADTGLEPPMIDGCEFPTHVLQEGVTPDAPTGFVRCNGGTIRRAEAVECHNPVPTGVACGDQSGTCSTDADCTAQPHGACLYFSSFFGGCECAYGCSTDADCGDGMICICGGTAPGYPASTMCAPSTCTSDASCDSEQCVLGVEAYSCIDQYRAGCRTPADSCASSADCQDTENCLPGAADEPWSCSAMGVC